MDSAALALPAAAVLRLAKEALPDGFAVSKAAKEALARAAAVFALALGASAGDIARDKRRATVAGTDVLRALEELGLGEAVPLLRMQLQAHKDALAGKRATKKARVGGGGGSGGGGGGGSGGGGGGGSGGGRDAGAGAGAGSAATPTARPAGEAAEGEEEDEEEDDGGGRMLYEEPEEEAEAEPEAEEGAAPVDEARSDEDAQRMAVGDEETAAAAAAPQLGEEGGDGVPLSGQTAPLVVHGHPPHLSPPTPRQHTIPHQHGRRKEEFVSRMSGGFDIHVCIEGAKKGSAPLPPPLAPPPRALPLPDGDDVDDDGIEGAGVGQQGQRGQRGQQREERQGQY